MSESRKRSTRHPLLQARARELRKDITDSEDLLWKIVRNRRVANLKFRRQYVIEPFIADFACVECRLMVEIDGQSHDLRREEDRLRDEYLRNAGWTVLRFPNEDVKYRENHIVQEIVRASKLERK